MNYVRLFAGPDGESHFEDVAVELAPVAQYAKGIPDVYLSAPRASTALTFFDGSWFIAALAEQVKLS